MAQPFALPTQATTGFNDAAHYDQYRPTYPAEAVEKLLTHLRVKDLENSRIIDLACGTGKFTELLVARPEHYEIVAIEPHKGMRETLIKKNLGPRVKVLDGHAGNMPVEGEWGDALIAAQVSCGSLKVAGLKERRCSLIICDRHFIGLRPKSP